MAKKQKTSPQFEALELLKNVLPKTLTDQKLVEKIYSACEKEITSKVRVESFQKFCARAELPNLETGSVKEIQKQFEDSFGKGAVSVVPHPKKQAATVEVVLDGEVLEGVVKVGTSNGDEEGEDEFKPKYVPFPVSLPSDPELVWALARGETLRPRKRPSP